MRRWAIRLLKLALCAVFFYLGFSWVTVSGDSVLVGSTEYEEPLTYWNTLRPSRVRLNWGIRWQDEDSYPEFLLSFQGRDFGQVNHVSYIADDGHHAASAVLTVKDPHDPSVVYVEYHEQGEWDRPLDSRVLILRALDVPVYYRYEDHTGSGDLVLAERSEAE